MYGSSRVTNELSESTRSGRDGPGRASRAALNGCEAAGGAEAEGAVACMPRREYTVTFPLCALPVTPYLRA